MINIDINAKLYISTQIVLTKVSMMLTIVHSEPLGNWTYGPVRQPINL